MGLLPVINITKLPQEGMARGPSHGDSKDYQGDNTDFHNFTISFTFDTFETSFLLWNQTNWIILYIFLIYC